MIVIVVDVAALITTPGGNPSAVAPVAPPANVYSIAAIDSPSHIN